MKVAGIQAKDGRIEVAIGKEEGQEGNRGNWERNSRRQNGYGGLT